MKKMTAMLTAVLCMSSLICFTLFGIINVSAAAIADVDILESTKWSGRDVRIGDRFVNGGKAISVSPVEDAEEFILWSSFDEDLPEGCNELVFSISVRGKSEEYSIGVILGSGEYRSPAHTESVKSRDSHKIYVPLTEETAEALDYIEIFVTGSDLPEYAIFYGMSIDDRYTYSLIEKFNSQDIACAPGTGYADKNGINITPDKNGSASVSLSFMSDTSADGTYIVWLDAASTVSGSIGIKAEMNGKDVPVSKEQIIVSGSYSSVFTVDGSFSRLSFIFENLSFTENKSTLRLTGAGALYIGKNEKNDDSGRIISCRYENGRVAVKGELSDEAALKYVNSKLGLYVIPIWENRSNIFNDAPEIISGFSTLFTLYAEPDENYMNCLYQPVIIADDEIIPIGTPQLAYSALQNTQTNQRNSAASVCTLDRARSWGAVEANAGAEIIDINIDRLLKAQDVYSASLYSYKGNIYYFDSEYFSELSGRIRFASEIGIRIYGRLVRNGSTALGFDPTDAESMNTLCAVCEYLKSSFSERIYGYILGDAMNTSALSSPEETEKIAFVAAVAAEALRSGGNTEIYLPFDSAEEINPFAAYAAIRCCMAKYSYASTAMLYSCTRDPEGSAASVSRTVSVANSYGYSTDGGAIIWKADSDRNAESIADSYADLCKALIASDLKFAALDADFSSRSDDIYSALKSTLASKGIFNTKLEEFYASKESSEPLGTYALKSFDRSFDTTGWISGGAFDAVMTEISLLNNSRALRAHSKSVGETGMLVYRFDEPINMSKSSAVLSLGVESDSEGSANVTFIFGSSESRREYSTTVEYNTPTEIFCNMYNASTPVEYIIAIVNSRNECTLEMYSVELQSSELNDDELKKKLSPRQDSSVDPLLYVAVILVAAATVAVFSAFAKRKDK